MNASVVRRIVSGAVSLCVMSHLTATVLNNTPDGYNQDFRPFLGGWNVPGWRFFAPTPGTQNVHLLTRHTTDGTSEPSPWKDVTPSVPHGWSTVFFNPQSRGPKVLFDAMQQFSLMSSNYVDMPWVVNTPAYLLVKSACLQTLPEGATAFQFMLLNLFPAEPTDRQMKPVITSDWFPVEGATEKGRDAAGAL